MDKIFSRAVELVRGTWPVLAAGYLIQMVTGTIMLASAWSVGRMMPKIGLDLVGAFDPDMLLRLATTYLGTIGMAFIWVSIGMTISWILFVFFTGGVLGVFKGWALEEQSFSVDRFVRSGFEHLKPLAGLNVLLWSLFLALNLVVMALGFALASAGGALALDSTPSAGLGLVLFLLIALMLCPLVAGFFLTLASGVASARLVWDSLPVLTAARYFYLGLKERFWLHVGLGAILALLGGAAFVLVLLVSFLIHLAGGGGAGAAAVAMLLEFVIFNLYAVFYLAAMTALMERLRPGGSGA
jgi:hypothetical protein